MPLKLFGGATKEGDSDIDDNESEIGSNMSDDDDMEGEPNAVSKKYRPSEEDDDSEAEDVSDGDSEDEESDVEDPDETEDPDKADDEDLEENQSDLEADIEIEKKKTKKGKKRPVVQQAAQFDDNDLEQPQDDIYYQKLKSHIKRSTILEHHPEIQFHNYEEIETLSNVVRNQNGQIIDPFHTTVPFLTKYEKADVLGKRASQINEGAPLFTQVDPSVIDGYLIALKEFEEKKIPFIIQRPLPNGSMEYWKLQDLEVI